MTYRTRFAPSPTGPLHLGHAYSALLAHDTARKAGGQFFVRLDDIDQSRARPYWAAQIEEDLSWLGVTWDGPIWSQNARSDLYLAALRRLWDMGVLYPCSCSRADIKAAANAPQEGTPITGPDGIVYPGTCAAKTLGAFSTQVALRLNVRNALEHIDPDIKFSESGKAYQMSGQQFQQDIGDVVLARKDMAASYHLSIVIDDAEQGITDVIRGEDLREATFIHALLQKLLGLTTPNYMHHRLIRDEDGRRLAKRDDARAIAKFRADGMTPADIRALVGL